jgi:heat shock protein HtpX
MAAYGLYTHIRSNRVRSVFLIGGLFFLVYMLTFAGALLVEGFTARDNTPLDIIIGRAWGKFVFSVPFATIGTAIWLLIAYRIHQRLIDGQTGAHGVTRQEEPKLYNLLENLCISRGIPMPKLKITEDMALNAYATGLNEKQYTIAVTRGLLQRLDDHEIEAVLAHELTHIRNGDVKLLVVAVVLAGIVSFIGELTFRALFNSRGSGGAWRSSSSGNRKGGGGALVAILIALAIIALAWLFSIVIRFALSRSREYLADAGAVELTKNPDAMIMALRKIENRGELRGATSAVMEMCFDNPHSGFADLFSTHPAIEARVAALVQSAGGRDPGPIALPEPDEEETAQVAEEETQEAGEEESRGESGPWGTPQREPERAPQAAWAPDPNKPNPWRS